MIEILRIGHRISRDKRITTHVALVARAFGAKKIYIDRKDTNLEKNIKKICDNFGGDFQIITGVNKNNILKKWDGKIVHLTMYGQNLLNGIKKIDKNKNLLIIIGAEKVPPEIYQIADYNISVGNQPHSEVAALAIFLDRYNEGTWINKKFDGKIEIQPNNRGKKVIVND